MFVIVSIVRTARPSALGTIELDADSPKLGIEPSPVVIVAVQPAAANPIAAREMRSTGLFLRMVPAQLRGAGAGSPGTGRAVTIAWLGVAVNLFPHEITRRPGCFDRSLVAAALARPVRARVVQPDHWTHGALYRHRRRPGRRAPTRLRALAHARPAPRAQPSSLDSCRRAGESRRGDERHRHADDAARRRARHRRRTLDRVP